MVKQFKGHLFLVLLCIFITYSLCLIFRSSYVIDHVRYFSLFDDMMVSMRYGHNLAQGFGLVWNPGERVEGTTNPLWTIYMGIIHLLPIPLEKTSFVIQITGMILLLWTLIIVKKIVNLVTKGNNFILFGSLLFTAFYFPLNNWSTILGTEVSALTLCITASAYFALKIIQDKKLYMLFYIILSIGTLVRIDFIVPATGLIFLTWFYDRKNFQRHLKYGASTFLACILLQEILRYWYYHDLFPNTYYLKMTGFPILLRIGRGIYVGLKSFNLLLIFLPLLYIVITKNKSVIILYSVFIVQFLYSMYVGGDAWEQFGGANRYLAIAMPAFFISFFITLNSLRQIFIKQFKNKNLSYSYVEVVILLLFFAIFNSTNDNSLLELFLIKPPATAGENKLQTRMAHSLTKLTKPNARIAIVWAGTTPYFAPREFVDLLGKNDKVIAREKVKYNLDNFGPLERYKIFWPGHIKWDYEYVIREKPPDIFGQVFPSDQANKLTAGYKRIVTPEGFEYYISKNTNKLNL